MDISSSSEISMDECDSNSDPSAMSVCSSSNFSMDVSDSTSQSSDSTIDDLLVPDAPTNSDFNLTPCL